MKEYKILQFIESRFLLQWDIKRFFKRGYNSKYSMILLQKCIKEESQKYNIHDLNTEIGILGVNNQTGIFDAYKEHSSKIKQKYKKMQTGWIAYNPYRVNVGSIGIKKDYHLYDYISPAYVVFSCFDNILSEYLFLLMKTNIFNTIIRDNTTGTVRQNLSFETLSNLQIPLPLIERQRELINNYNNLINKAEQNELLAKQTENEIQEYISNELGISTTKKEKKKGLQFVEFKDIERWDVYNSKSIDNSQCFPNIKLSYIVQSKPQYGAGFRSKEYDGKIRYIRITDINDDGSLNNERVSADGYSDRYLLKENDFLIARSGNTVGKTFLYKNEVGKSIYAGYLIKFELNTDVVMPEYLLYYTKSTAYKNWINGNMRVAAQPNINSQQYMDSPVVLPPIDIQKAIVEHINEQKEQIKQLRLQAENLKKEALEEFEKEIFA